MPKINLSSICSTTTRNFSREGNTRFPNIQAMVQNLDTGMAMGFGYSAPAEIRPIKMSDELRSSIIADRDALKGILTAKDGTRHGFKVNVPIPQEMQKRDQPDYATSNDVNVTPEHFDKAVDQIFEDMLSASYETINGNKRLLIALLIEALGFSYPGTLKIKLKEGITELEAIELNVSENMSNAVAETIDVNGMTKAVIAFMKEYPGIPTESIVADRLKITKRGMLQRAYAAACWCMNHPDQTDEFLTKGMTSKVPVSHLPLLKGKGSIKGRPDVTEAIASVEELEKALAEKNTNSPVNSNQLKKLIDARGTAFNPYARVLFDAIIAGDEERLVTLCFAKIDDLQTMFGGEVN